MCGICGFNWEDKSLVKDMAQAMLHRGPDDSGFHLGAGISLGHRRLSIIDLKSGKQPMYNEDGSVVVVYNGEIYNFKEIRKSLENKGHRFRTNSDTEAVVHSYEEYGERCLEHFNGMFAFAIWDSNKKKLFIARDRLGIKPLYYYFKDNAFIFASEVKSILQHDNIKREINKEAFYQFFSYLFPLKGDYLIKDIYELLPGYFLTFDKGGLVKKRYWQPRSRTVSRGEDYFCRLTEKKLLESVKMRMISDVPLGASLSGGLDSSLIVAMMNKFTPDKVKTVTVGYEDVNNEFMYARKVAEHCNLDHREMVIELDQLSSIIPEVVWHMDQPPVKTSVFPTFFFSKKLREKVKVALVGEGSDEIFAGYGRYKMMSLNLSSTAGFFRKSLRNFLTKKTMYADNSKSKKSLLDYYKQYSYYLKFFNIFRKGKYVPLGYFNRKDETSVSKGNGFIDYEKESYDVIRDISAKGDGDALGRVLHIAARKELPSIQLLRVDKMSMTHSLEARVPFVDHELVEIAFSMPSNLKLNNLTEKYIVKKVALKYLPREIIYRKKEGLQSPIASWVNKEFKDVFSPVLNNSSLVKNGYIDSRFIEKLLRKDISSQRATQIWFVSMLEIWNRIFIEPDNINNQDLSINAFL